MELIKQNSPRKFHGMKYHKLYARWTMMRQRCNNPKSKDYKHYGGRGISICDEFDFFPNYAKYIESLSNAYKKGYSVDRINNNGHYEQGNLKWSTQTEQMFNTRIKSTNTTGIKGVSPAHGKFQATFKGKYLGIFNTVEEAEKSVKLYKGIYYDTIH